MDFVAAALLAAGAVVLAFLAKLTGLIVLSAALMAGSMVSLAFSRRITYGTIGGALGGFAALAVNLRHLSLNGIDWSFGDEPVATV